LEVVCNLFKRRTAALFRMVSRQAGLSATAGHSCTMCGASITIRPNNEWRIANAYCVCYVQKLNCKTSNFAIFWLYIWRHFFASHSKMQCRRSSHIMSKNETDIVAYSQKHIRKVFWRQHCQMISIKITSYLITILHLHLRI